MAFILADRVRETASAPGTGTVTLLGAVTGYQAFSAGIGANNTTYYVIADQSGNNWEVGLGTIGAGGTTLARITVLSSSNSGSLVNFSNGTQDVFCDYPASKAVNENASGNVDGYPITGGTINGTTIGGTTPAAGTFTTITGQTARLNGTGQNLLLQSNTFNTTWATQATSLTGSQSDPFGGSTAWSLLADGTTGSHGLSQNIAYTNGLAYTYSIYLKRNTNNFAQLRFASAVGGGYANFDLNAGTIGTTGAASGNTPTSAITSIGSGWYRCSMTVAVNASTTTGAIVYIVSSASATAAESNSLATSIFLYGAQVEIGSTANTYIPTTTTAVYGTPTLSFSGVSTLGLESNGALFLQPAGTGAIQAQATTSTTAGGNARGANAVDWQTSRSGATRVASGAQSTVAGGDNNGATAVNSVVAGGTNNVASGTQSFIGSGNGNVTTNPYSNVIGGYGNTAAGYYNFIGAGYINSGTASAAVTTQSGTMNGTTAVTLSGSNANIKVGQFITGTSIANFTYVAAISGTALTLSQAASGSSTSTLSFYTPHGVVVGGGNNQATGSYSFIGGGGDAGTAANRNVASGDWSFVGGGQANQATGIGSVVTGGGLNVIPSSQGNTSSGISSFVGGGAGNVSSGTYSFLGAGLANTSNAVGSAVIGGYRGSTRSIQGNHVFSACVQPIIALTGISQSALLVLARETTDATATVLTSNTSAASGTNQVILPNNSAYLFKATVISNVTGGGNTSGWKLEGVIKRGANAASTTIVGSVTTTLLAQDAGAATWAIAATADTTNGGLRITFTGQASTTIRTVCKVETTEVTF